MGPATHIISLRAWRGPNPLCLGVVSTFSVTQTHRALPQLSSCRPLTLQLLALQCSTTQGLHSIEIGGLRLGDRLQQGRPLSV